jgi:hypothetical protein
MKTQNNKSIIIIFIGLVLLAAGPMYARDFYVANKGSDANPGTMKKPFATIERARDEARKLVAAGLKEDVIVFFRGGTYLLDSTVVFGLADSGSKEYTITYAAYPGEIPVFSGGVGITSWSRLEDSGAFPPAARGKWVTDLPGTKGGKWRFHALFDNSALLPRAYSEGFRPPPGFDPDDNKDFRLCPDSPAWKLGFKSVDFDNIGLTTDFPDRYR